MSDGLDGLYRLYDSDGYSPFGERAKAKAEAERLRKEEARQKKIEEEFRNNTFVLAQTLSEGSNHEEHPSQANAEPPPTYDEAGLEVVDLQKDKENEPKNTVARNLFQKFGIDPQGQPIRNSKVARKDSPLDSSPSPFPSPDIPSSRSLTTQEPAETPTQLASPSSVFSDGDDVDLCPYCLQNPCDHFEDILDTTQRLSLYYSVDIPYNEPKDMVGNFQRRKTFRSIYSQLVIAKGRDLYATSLPRRADRRRRGRLTRRSPLCALFRTIVLEDNRILFVRRDHITTEHLVKGNPRIEMETKFSVHSSLHRHSIGRFPRFPPTTIRCSNTTGLSVVRGHTCCY